MNLLCLTSADLKQILKLRLRIEAYERELLATLANARRRPKPTRRHLPPRQKQPSLRSLISAILKKNGGPMSVDDIYEATLLAGYHWRSQEPLNALNVKLYTDRTFKKSSPAHFILRPR